MTIIDTTNMLSLCGPFHFNLVVGILSIIFIIAVLKTLFDVGRYFLSRIDWGDMWSTIGAAAIACLLSGLFIAFFGFAHYIPQYEVKFDDTYTIRELLDNYQVIDCPSESDGTWTVQERVKGEQP